MESYDIVNMKKFKKSDITPVGTHNDRCDSNGNEVAPSNSNGEQTNSNVHWDKEGKTYNQKEWTEYCKDNNLNVRINNEIKERYKVERKIRKDAVYFTTFIFSSDTEKMQEIFESGRGNEWVKANKEFIEEIYGKENILSINLHMDETTPHLHISVIPLTKEGRLSQKSFINGMKEMTEMRTEHAKIMETFGLKRGEQGNGAKHIEPKNLNKEKVKGNYEYNRN